MNTLPFNLSAIPWPLQILLRKICKLPLLETWYSEWHQQEQPLQQESAMAFLNYVLKQIGRPYHVQHQGVVSDIPAKGPVVIVANHPLGGLEGMILAQHFLQYRPDLKVVTNKLLLRFPEFAQLFIGVDILGRQRDNRQSLRDLNEHVSQGGAVLIFPTGTVGKFNWRNKRVDDIEWHTTAANVALRHDAWCLPVHVDGRNSLLFYASAWIHKRLRTLLLPRAMLERTTRPINITVGRPLQLAEAGLGSARAATDYLRVTTELIGHDCIASQAEVDPRPEISSMAPPLSLDYLREYELIRQGERVVFCVPYDALGPLQIHLATKRERTFRASGEGTGKAMDIDRFDPHYLHLIAWDFSTHQLIGAYRAFRLSDAIESDKKKDLYSRSLFRYPDSFLKYFSGAIEVGRSFVTEAYQRDPRALDLLWLGLGALMMKNPNCHTFIGCVSISGNYAPQLRSLLHDTLLAGFSVDQQLRQKVTPRRRFNTSPTPLSAELLANLANVSAINKLLGHAGLDVRVPVLIRQYLALNGGFIDFSVNSNFSDSLDGLIVVDLRQAPARYLKRYLGEQGQTVFQQQWRPSHVA